MSRNAGTSVENNFTRGLITEVTGVNSPENSVTDTMNVYYDRRGRASSRKGFNYENDHVNQAIVQDGVRNTFLWETVSDSSDLSFVVVQVGSRLRFFSSTNDSSLSSGLKSFSVDLLTYKISNFSDQQVYSTYAQFTTGKGYLFVAHPNCDPIYIKYDSSTDSITANRVTITSRDFEGVTDTVTQVDQRPTVLTTPHKYNLYNQGWYARIRRSDGTYGNALDSWDDIRSDFPANSDVWWYYAGVTDGIGEAGGLEYLSPSVISTRTGLFGNTPAARGHYILNSFSTNRSSLSGIAGVVETTSNGQRPSVVAFFAGRAFYSGIKANGYSSQVYFSQIIENDDQIGKCYQANDPTSKDSFDLLDSDGGVIEIQDINSIVDMKVIGQSLYVFATNGVWSISGTADAFFKATDYTVSKVSSYPALSRQSIVDVGGLPIWWNYEGIFTLQKNQIGLLNEVTSATDQTIKTFYDNIPQSSKLEAKGSFNDQTGLVYWLYSTDSVNPTLYTNILVLDAVSLAFYVYSIPQISPKIVGLIPVRSYGGIIGQDFVVTNLSDQVTTSGGSQVYVEYLAGTQVLDKEFKFLVESPTTLTFAEINDGSYLDWGSVIYDQYFITGYRIRGELLKRFQTNYLTIITEDEEGSSCYVQPLWDYSNSVDSGRFGNPQQVYRSRTFRNYQRSRLVIRGTGYSLQFKFFGLGGKPFTIVGWAGFETSDGVP